MSLRSWLFFGLLLCAGCDSLFGSFTRANPKNCVRSPDSCGAGEVCDVVAERCVGIGPDADVFAPVSVPLNFKAQHALAGNFDGNSLPDVVLVGVGQALVLYDPGTSMGKQKVITTKTASSPFYAVVTKIDSDGLDDLAIISERGDTSGTFGTIEFCAARGPDMLQPFACLPPGDLRFPPKAVLIADLIDDSTPDLAAVDDKGEIKVCRVLSISSMEGACDILLPAANSEPVSYAQLALLDDINGDGRPELGVLLHATNSTTKVRVLRTAGGGKPAISEAAPLTLDFPVLLAGNFNQTGKLGLVAVGSNAGGGSLVAQPFTDLTGPVPIASTSVMVQPGTLFGDPTKARACAVGQFDGLGGTLADDIACQLETGQLAFFSGSPGGVTTQLLRIPSTPIPGSHLLSAPFGLRSAGRHDLLVYSNADHTGVGLISLLRSAGQSARGLLTRTAFNNTNNFTPPDFALLAGSFQSSMPQQLALLPRGGSGLTLYSRDANGVITQPGAAEQIALPDTVDNASRLPCGDGLDALVIAYRNDKRPSVYRFGGTSTQPQPLASQVGSIKTLGADINGDGLADLISLRSDGKVQAALAQSQTCTLGPLTDLVPPTVPPPIEMAVGDMNRDGAADLVVMGDGGTVRVFRNQLDGGGKALGVFELVAEKSLPIELTPGQMMIGEARQKGAPELLISMTPPAGNSQLYALSLSADGRSLVQTQTTVNTLVRGPTLVLRDLNLDGLAEVLMLDPATGIMSLTSFGQDAAGKTRSYYVGIQPSGLSVGFLDGDVQPDVAVMTQMNKVQPTAIALSVAYGLAAGELK